MNHPINLNNTGPVIKYTDMKEEMKNEVIETAKLGIVVIVYYWLLLLSIIGCCLLLLFIHLLLLFIYIDLLCLIAIDKCNYDKEIACYIK